MTFKNRSRSPKSNQLSPSQPCIYVSLVKWFKRYRVGKKLRGRRRGRRRRRDQHQKQYVHHLRLGGHNYLPPYLLTSFLTIPTLPTFLPLPPYTTYHCSSLPLPPYTISLPPTSLLPFFPSLNSIGQLETLDGNVFWLSLTT